MMLRPILIMFLILIITLPGVTGWAQDTTTKPGDTTTTKPGDTTTTKPGDTTTTKPGDTTTKQGDISPPKTSPLDRAALSLETIATNITSTWNWIYLILLVQMVFIVIGLIVFPSLMSKSLHDGATRLNEVALRLNDVAIQIQNIQRLMSGGMAARAAPRITTLPAGANVGTMITIQGNNFQQGVTVEIGRQSALVRRDSETSLTVRVPEQIPPLAAGATRQVTVLVRNPDGQDHTWQDVFTVTGV